MIGEKESLNRKANRTNKVPEVKKKKKEIKTKQEETQEGIHVTENV